MLNAGATVSRNCDKIYFTFSTGRADLIDGRTHQNFGLAAYVSWNVNTPEFLHLVFSRYLISLKNYCESARYPALREKVDVQVH